MTTALNQLFGLTGKVAVVTGGGSGIGAGISEVLAAAGATVVVAGRGLSKIEQQVEKLRASGHSAVAVHVDVAEEDSVLSACQEILWEHGTPWLLVNNAAVQDRSYLHQTTVAEWDRINAVNARGAFLMTRELSAAMIACGAGGRIVNVGSNVLRGGVIKGLTAYAASKGALTALSLASAHELAEHAITVNTVLPAAVVTPGAVAATGPMTAGPATRPVPFGLQDPREIGAAVLYFASASARPVTNQIIAVDGGFSIS